MKTLIKLICIVVLTLSLNSCSTFKITTTGHETVEEITTLNQLRWEMQTDWRYRPYQPYSWYNNYYFNNIMWQYGYNTNQWSFYNRHDLWWNWWGQNWYSPWYSNVYNNWNGYGWNSWYQTPHYAYGRRGSRGRSNTGVYSYTNRTNRSRLLIDSKVSTSESRTYLQTLRNLSNANRSIQRTKPPRTQTPIQPVVPQRPRTIPNRVTNPPRTIRNNRVPNSNTIRINSSSSRPNSTTRPVRQSVPQTTTKSPRKRDN